MDRKMMQRIILVILALVMVLSIIAPVVMATETGAETTETTGAIVRGEFECGDDMTWNYEEGTLTISGSGEMDDYEEDAPWAKYKQEITKVVFEGSVTYIGARAFNNYDAIKEVDFGNALKEIGEQTFRSCEGLTEIFLPKTFKVFGPESFNSCTNLKEIHCAGVFPSFKENCLWAVYATIYYPAANPWSVSLIQQLEDAFHGRIQFLDSDGVDHYVPTEPTEETTGETTEETTEPTQETAVETEAVTEPVTEATTEAATEAATIPTGEPQTEPIEELLPVQEEEDSKGWIGLVIVAAVLALLGLGGLAFGKKKHKKGKFSRR